MPVPAGSHEINTCTCVVIDWYGLGSGQRIRTANFPRGSFVLLHVLFLRPPKLDVYRSDYLYESCWIHDIIPRIDPLSDFLDESRSPGSLQLWINSGLDSNIYRQVACDTSGLYRI